MMVYHFCQGSRRGRACVAQAYARLKYNPGREFLEATTRRAMGVFHQYTPQELGNTLCAPTS